MPDARTVLVTRDGEDFEATAALARGAGLLARSFPVVRRRALLTAADLPDRLFDWCLFTSPGAVRLWPGSFPPGRRIGCVGPATARAAEREGWPVDFVPSQALAAVFAAELPAAPGESALLPCSARSAPRLKEGLAARGLRTTRLEVYTTEPRTGADVDEGATDDAAHPGAFDAVLFASPSAVDGWRSLFGDEARARIGAARVLSIGATTSDALRNAGLAPDFEGPAGDLAALFAVFAASASSVSNPAD